MLDYITSGIVRLVHFKEEDFIPQELHTVKKQMFYSFSLH